MGVRGGEVDAEEGEGDGDVGGGGGGEEGQQRRKEGCEVVGGGRQSQRLGQQVGPERAQHLPPAPLVPLASQQLQAEGEEEADEALTASDGRGRRRGGGGVGGGTVSRQWGSVRGQVGEEGEEDLTGGGEGADEVEEGGGQQLRLLCTVG